MSGICTLNKMKNVITMAIGNLTNITLCLAIQEREFDKDEDLPIPTRILRDAGLKAMRITDMVPEKEDVGEFSNIFDQIFGGKTNEPFTVGVITKIPTKIPLIKL